MLQLKVEAKVEEYLKEYQTRRKEILSALPDDVRRQIEESDAAQIETATAAIDAAKGAAGGTLAEGEANPSGMC